VIGVDMKSRKLLWQYRHPERLFPFYSSAAVSQGSVVLGGRDKMVHALDMKTGKARWTFMTNARVESSPAIVGTRVFIGSSDGRLYELDLLKGGKVWEFDAGAAISASPAVAAGRLVVGTHDGRLYCFG
jgi:outer membrane protein assembly factor BamB